MKEERTTRKMWPGRSARYPWRFLLFPGSGGLFSHSCLHLCLTQIKQKSLDKAKEEEKASKEFAAMEAAALKAYQEDLKRLGLQSGTLARTPLFPHRSSALAVVRPVLS